ncbi:MAG: hypothetical protein Q9167_006586 [Letrouitia subvulpina]
MHLPGHLFTTYAKYKKGTRTFIQWLSSQQLGFTQDVSVISTAELRQLGHRLTLRGISAPEDVMSALHNTIHARTEISEYFSRLGTAEENASNKAHKHFTAVLKQIYNDLRIRKKLMKLDAITPPASPPSRSSNLFEHLERVDCVGDDECFFLSQQDQLDLLDELGCSCCSKEQENQDDVIGHYMAIQLDDLLDSVKATWSQAANNAVPVTVASATTNTAYRFARNYQNDLQEYGLDDPESLRDRYRKCEDSLGLNDIKQNPKQVSVPKASEAGKHISLQVAWEALKGYSSGSKEPAVKTFSQSSAKNQPCIADQACAIPIDNPSTFIQDPEKVSIRSSESDRAAMDLLLERMELACSNIDLATELQTFVQSPVLLEFKLYLDAVGKGTTKDKKKGIQHGYTLTLVFGLRMMIESYKAYIFASAKRSSAPTPQTCHTSTANHRCRVDALTFSNDIFHFIDSLMKGGNALCRCLHVDSHCVLDYVGIFQSYLLKFKSTKRFDIFYSTPWTAGNHILYTLTGASTLGAYTWHRGSFVGTVLYTYHCLMLLKVLQPSDFPLFERICVVFEDTVFRGQRPKYNLCSCYNLWLGSKVDFTKRRANNNNRHHHQNMHDHAQGDNINSGRKWSLRALKEDKSNGAEDAKRSFSPCKVSLFALLAEKDFVADDDDVLAWLYCNKAYGKATWKDIHRARTLRDNDPNPSSFFARLQSALVKEFRETDELGFPVGRLNYFAVYDVCMEILKHIHGAEHPHENEKEKNATICSCASRRLLRATDLYLDGKTGLKDVELVRNCERAFREVMEGRKMADFFWDV